MINDIFNILLPQITLGFFIILQLIFGMIFSPRLYRYARFISIVGISVSIALLSTVQVEPQYFGFRGSIMSDGYTLLFHFLILLCGFFVALLMKQLVIVQKRNAYTIHAIFLSAIFGAMSVISANDFLTLFVSMEMLGFSTYFLIASHKGYLSKEASFKYLITSAVSTGVFLFGVSYLYGMTGSLNFSDIYSFIAENNTPILYSVASIMVVLGLISKLAIFPFANWVIDVYKGCETSVLAFLSTIPKLAIFGIVCRLLVFPISNCFGLTFVIILLSLFTAFWANTYAIREKNVKAILACSAAANASYVLLTASIVSVYNLSAVIFYLICYSIMNIGAFAFLNIYGDNSKMFVDDFRGIFHKNRSLAGAYSVVILALAGIPITSGFVAKIYLFTAIANSGLIFWVFLLALLLLTIVALYYYLKIIFSMFEKDDIDIKMLKSSFSQRFVLTTCAVITIILGVYPEIIIELCRFIAYNV